MLSSITPLGERTRDNRWGATVAWYVAGSALGGLTVGVAAGLLGSLAETLWWPTEVALGLTVVGILLVGLVFDFGLVGSVPSIHRQVNEDWLSLYRSWVYGGGFGYQLGLGVVTIVPTAATYVAYSMAFLSASIPGGAVVGVAYGFARALPILTVRRAVDPSGLRTFHRRMQRVGPKVGRLTNAGLAAGLIVAVSSLSGGF